MNTEIGIIANPTAGRGYRALAPVHEQSQRLRVPFHITNSISEIAGTLRKLVNEKGVKVLLVYGGDGTLHRVIDILIYEHGIGHIKALPLVLPMGGGTMRAIFHWLGWQENPTEIMRRVIATPLDRLPVRKMRPLAISFSNPDKGREETHYGFMFIMGAVNRVVELYEADDKTLLGGVKHFSLGAMASLSGIPLSHRRVIRQFDARLVADGKLLPQRTPLSIICSVSDTLLFGIKPFAGPAADNQFYTMCYSVPAWLVAALIPIEVRATWLPKGDRFFNAPVFSFEITPNTENTFFLDGEHFNCTSGQPVQLELGPEIELISHF